MPYTPTNKHRPQRPSPVQSRPTVASLAVPDLPICKFAQAEPNTGTFLGSQLHKHLSVPRIHHYAVTGRLT